MQTALAALEVLDIAAEYGYGIDTGGIDNVVLESPDNSDLLANIHCSAVEICWAGRTNQMYQVRYRTNVSGTNWFDLGTPLAGTGTNCVTDVITGIERRFYRVIRVP